MISEVPDVVIVGGGPAGLAAAIKAKESGLDRVVMIERGEYLGGLLNQCIHNGFGLLYFREDLTGPEFARRFIDQARGLGVECLLKSMAIKIFPDRRMIISSKEGLIDLSPKAIVLAMGCRERSRESLSVPGTRPAGIFTAGTAQRYVNIEGYLPGKAVVILGSGDVGMIMARRLTLEGAEVKAVVEVLPYVGGLIRNEVQCLHDFDIPILLRHTVTEVHGLERVEAVTVARVDESWNPISGTEKTLVCDTLLISAGLIPENELSRLAGIVLDPVTGGPEVDANMETSVSGIFAGGNVVHVNDLVDNVTWEGEAAGENAARFAAGRQSTAGKRILVKSGRNVRYAVPQTIARGQDVTLSFRVKEPAEQVRLRVGPLPARAMRAVKPSEMIRFSLSAEEWRKLDDSLDELIIHCESISKISV